jgi:hypothetical protein
MEYRRICANSSGDAFLPQSSTGDLHRNERSEIVSRLATDPECGDLIQGTGGFRKVRVGRAGMGKRGGARVVYILRNTGFPIFLVAAYAKNEKDNLTKKERNELAKRAEEIFARYGGNR